MKKQNKIIGVYADCSDNKVGQTFPYMQFLSQFGNVRLISTLDNLDNIENEVDMLVLPGGADVHVQTYGEAPGVMTGRGNQHYEYLDDMLLPKFIRAGKPIVGICRGMQRLNTWFGGTLNQHIVGHQQGGSRSSTDQEIQFIDNDGFHFVNSMHHQSVKKLGDDLEVIAYSQVYEGCYSDSNNLSTWREFDKNGIVKSTSVAHTVVEIFKHTVLPIWGFQYHPEEFNCDVAKNIINDLLK